MGASEESALFSLSKETLKKNKGKREELKIYIKRRKFFLGGLRGGEGFSTIKKFFIIQKNLEKPVGNVQSVFLYFPPRGEIPRAIRP